MTETAALPTPVAPSRSARSWWFALPGLLHAASAFAPATRVRVVGLIPFVQIHWTGGIVLVLGIGVALAAVVRRPRWMVLGTLLSSLIVAGMYVRIVYAPFQNFTDHLMRHVIHPAWGFIPMTASLALELVSALWLFILMRASARTTMPFSVEPPATAP